MSISENNSQSISTYSDSSQSISTYTDSNCTPFPSMTKSQRVKLNEILHREPIGYASTFECDAHSGFACNESVEPVEMIEHTQDEHMQDEQIEEQKYTENNSCCIIM